jgi:hypothetical protein
MMVSMPGLFEGIGGMDAAIVELDALADPVRTAAEDDHLAPVGRDRLAFRRLDVLALVAGIHIGRGRGELGGAGVDALVDRAHLEIEPQLLHRIGRGAGEFRRRASEKPLRFSRSRASRVLGRPWARISFSVSTMASIWRMNQGSNFEAAKISSTVRPRRRASAITSRRSAWPCPGRDDRGLVVLLQQHLVEAGQARLHRAQAFCTDSWKLRPIAIASPTDFIEVERIARRRGISRR